MPLNSLTNRNNYCDIVLFFESVEMKRNFFFSLLAEKYFSEKCKGCEIIFMAYYMKQAYLYEKQYFYLLSKGLLICQCCLKTS